MWKLYFSYMFNKHMRYVVALNLNVFAWHFCPMSLYPSHFLAICPSHFCYIYISPLSYIFSCCGVLLNYLEGASVSSGGPTTGLS